MPLPRFMSESITKDAAERGTSTHVFLQFASFEAIRDSGADGEIRRLSAAGFLTEKMASLVDVQQVEHFAADYRVIAIDPRGQGYSSKTMDGNDYLTHGQDLAALIDTLDLKDAVLIGWSTDNLDTWSYI